MLFDVMICMNQVNLTLAMHGLPRRGWRPAVVLYKQQRITPPAGSGLLFWPMGLWTRRALRWLAMLRLVRTVYIPHDRLNGHLQSVCKYARRVAYIDDGMDTWRKSPRNFDLPLQRPGADYFSFSEFGVAAAWLDGLNIRRECPLKKMSQGVQPSPLWRGIAHVLVESPGLRMPELIAELQLDPAQVLVVRHPSHIKRQKVPMGCRSTEGREFNLESELMALEGRNIYFGESCSLIFALHTTIAERNQVWAQMESAQWENLLLSQWRENCSDRVTDLWRMGRAGRGAPAAVAAPAAAHAPWPMAVNG